LVGRYGNRVRPRIPGEEAAYSGFVQQSKLTLDVKKFGLSFKGVTKEANIDNSPILFLLYIQ